jgi:sterol desaturase/sphingolipid hydroxylase (fatty acid hydroxylase superfamily)
MFESGLLEVFTHVHPAIPHLIFIPVIGHMIYLSLGSHFVPPFFAGFMFGYLVYDSTHYAIHHFHLRGKIGMYLRKRHLRHHFVQPDYNFGISSPFWDIVFGTLKDRPTER